MTSSIYDLTISSDEINYGAASFAPLRFISAGFKDTLRAAGVWHDVLQACRASAWESFLLHRTAKETHKAADAAIYRTLAIYDYKKALRFQPMYAEDFTHPLHTTAENPEAMLIKKEEREEQQAYWREAALALYRVLADGYPEGQAITALELTNVLLLSLQGYERREIELVLSLNKEQVNYRLKKARIIINSRLIDGTIQCP